MATIGYLLRRMGYIQSRGKNHSSLGLGKEWYATSQSIDYSKEIPKILESEFWFYQQLSQEEKEVFVERVKVFLSKKRFLNRATSRKRTMRRMHALIAATATQVSFGLNEEYLQHFTHVIIYEDDYLSPATGKKHKGEVHPKGAIILSWKSFEEGYQIHDDGVALGIHEFVHALILQNDKQHFLEKVLNTAHFNRAVYYCKKELISMRQGKPSFLRDYASTNMHEFISVAVEHFFERPFEFFASNEPLYLALTDVLQQDPRQRYDLGNLPMDPH